MQTIKLRITPVARFMQRIDELRGSADALGASRPTSRTALAAPAPRGPDVLLDATRDAVVGSLTFVRKLREFARRATD